MSSACRSTLLLLAILAGGCDSLGVWARRSALKPDYPAATYDQALAYAVGRQNDFQPSFVVVHVAQGYYNGTIAWFKDPASGVSSHYVVSSSTGAVTQMVEEKDTAYHVGHSISLTSIGIEHEGFVADPQKWFTDKMYAGSAELVKNIADRWGIPRDRCHILGHDQVPDPSNPCLSGGAEHHTDPGSGWDWSKYMGLIGGSGTACSWSCQATTGSLVGVVRKGSLLPTAPALAGVKVSIGTKSTTTDASGFYRFDGLQLKTWFTITASAAGYQTVKQNQAVVIPLDNYSNFALTPAPATEAGAAGPEAGPPPGPEAGPAPEAGAVVDLGGPEAGADLEPPGLEPATPEPPGAGGGCSLVAGPDRPAGSAPGLLWLAVILLLASRLRRIC